MKNITTGVDRLIAILREKQKISLNAVSKTINMEQGVVQEWAELLEKEGVITITYKFSKAWLELKKIDNKTVEVSAKEVISEKDAFSRKIEAAIKSIEKETSGFEEIKNSFNNIQSNVKTELETVRKEMRELEKYENLKTNLRKEIESQKKDYENFKKLYDRELSEYDEKEMFLIADLEKEKKKAEETKKALENLSRQKEQIEKKIDDSVKQMQLIEKHVEEESKNAKEYQKNIENILSQIESLKIVISKSKEKELKRISEKLNISSAQIMKKHDDLLKNANIKLQEIKDYTNTGKQIYKSFDGLIAKRINSEKIMEQIDKEKQELIKELQDMDKKVKAFSIISKDSAVQKQMKEIEKKIQDFERKRNSLVGKIDKFVSFLK